MTWLLLAIAAILIGLGVWGGPRQKDPGPRPRPAPDAPDPGEDPWAVITKPLERQEAIHIPEHRPWYLPGADRRFQRGLLVGLGSGLLFAAVAANFVPRGGFAQPPVAEISDTKTTPPAVTAPPTTPPAAAPVQTPPPVPATPVNVTFVVELGDSSPTIAANLKAAGLIANEQAFIDRVSELGVDTSLKAGTFIIPTGATLDEVIGALTA